MFLFFPLPVGEALGREAAEGLPYREAAAVAAAAAEQQRDLSKSHIYR